MKGPIKRVRSWRAARRARRELRREASADAAVAQDFLASPAKRELLTRLLRLGADMADAIADFITGEDEAGADQPSADEAPPRGEAIDAEVVDREEPVGERDPIPRP